MDFFLNDISQLVINIVKTIPEGLQIGSQNGVNILFDPDGVADQRISFVATYLGFLRNP